jgi:hypothetical protein
VSDVGEPGPRALDLRGLGRGDFGRVDWADREIGFVLADGREPGSWTGITAMVNTWGAVLTAWESLW